MDPRPTIAVYGGSFNPPHTGHAFALEWLHQRASRIVVVPAYHHALKSSAMAPWHGRVAMVEALVTSSLPQGVAEVDTLEAERDGPSYTIDTLDLLARKHPDHKIRLAVGEDVLTQTHLWQQWDRISTEYPPLIVPRPPGSMSSTLVRMMIMRGEPLTGIVPDLVLGAMNLDWYREGT